MSPAERARFRARAGDFDPGLRAAIGELIEDVRANGDDAIVRALREFDGCDVPTSALAATAEPVSGSRNRCSSS